MIEETMKRRLKTGRSAVALSVVLMISACSMTPEYKRPEMAVPGQLPAADQGVSVPDQTAVSSASASASAPVGAIAELPWASYFPDQRLQGLIQRALDNNRDLRVAVLNIDQLRATYQIQNSERFPTLNAAINGTRQPSTQPPHKVTTTVNGGLTVAAYELDLFGRVRALSDAAAGQVLASEEARRSAHIGLVASVANTYYALWADRWQLALSEQTLKTRQDSFKLLQLKFDNGVLNELDLRSAQSLVEAARITRAQAQRQWAQDLNALQLLLGGTVPADLLPPAPDVAVAATAVASAVASASAPALAPARSNTAKLNSVSSVNNANSNSSSAAAPEQTILASLWPGLSELPVGLSSEVLLQRPDIAQAEQQLISANANIGAARAARFPRISLTASAGVVSDSLSGLFDDGRSAWSFAPSITLPIFDAGRAKANVDVANVRRDIALAQYDKAIQTAFKEVADALAARRTYAEQADAQLAQAQAEAARMRLSTLRYDTGVASQLDLLDAQRALFSSQQALIASQLARQQAHISVYRALGGGWRAGDVAPQQTVQATP
jgi:multidrug efflux system outer membrane protein